MTSVNERELSPILISINFDFIFDHVDSNNVAQTHFINKCRYANGKKAKASVKNEEK